MSSNSIKTLIGILLIFIFAAVAISSICDLVKIFNKLIRNSSEHSDKTKKNK